MSRIKDARQYADLSQKAVSDILGIPLRTLQSWECGSRVPPAYVERMVVEKLISLKRLKMGIDEWKRTSDSIVDILVDQGLLHSESEKVLARKIVSEQISGLKEEVLQND